MNLENIILYKVQKFAVCFCYFCYFKNKNKSENFENFFLNIDVDKFIIYIFCINLLISSWDIKKVKTALNLGDDFTL